MPLETGTRLGSYEILSPIGAGGMGEVYRARDPRLGRDVAVKVLPAGFSADPERLRRFEQEARAAAALNHPNVLAVYDVGTTDGAPYIVSELLEGDTLRGRIAAAFQEPSAQGLALRKAIDYAIQIAHGLAAAHEKGIVHRDLKPENVFVTSDGRVKILDFGLAKLTEAAPAAAGASALPTSPADSRPGMVLGTVGYMAPEQVRGHIADHRSDIFAFGAILYEMLSGHRAFRGPTTADTISAILDKDPPDLPIVEHHIPPALARVVDRCLEKNPARRFQSTHDLAFALEGLSSHSEASTVGAMAAPRAATGRSRLAWSLAGAVLLVVTVVAAALYLRRPPAEADEKATRFTISASPDLTLNANAGSTISLAVSPNGRQIAYVAAPRAGGQTLLVVRALDALEGRSLSGTGGAVLPFWSPDSRSIGFFAQGKLKKIDVAGGGPQVLCDAPGGVGGTWGRDGTIVFAPSGTSGLLRVSAAGGQPTAAAALDAGAQETSHRWPWFLPDGRRFLYVALTGSNPTPYLGSLDSPNRKRLMAADSKTIYANPGHLLFVRLNTLFAQGFDVEHGEVVGDAVPIAEQVGALTGVNTGGGAFSASENGELVYRTGLAGVFSAQLSWLDRTGKVVGSVGQPSDYRGLELAPDGHHVAVHPHELVGGGDAWLFDLTRGNSSRFTFAGHTLSAIWSPDSSRIAFGSNRPATGQTLPDPYGGTFNLYEKQSDNTGDPKLLLDAVAAGQTPTYKQPTSWSSNGPNGEFLVYEVWDPKTSWDLWALPLSGDRKPRPLVHSEFQELEGQVSPDGRWLAYTSDESKHWEVVVVPLTGAGKSQISTGGGRFPRWRGDGKELFYFAEAAPRKLMAVEVGANGSAFTVGIPRPLFDVTIAGVYFQSTPIPQNAKTPFPYDVTRDGQRFLVAVDATQITAETPITVVENWPATIKK